MKRELLENVKVQPYTSGDAIDREGYLSAVLGVSLGAATGTPTGITVKVTFTECDTEGGSYARLLEEKKKTYTEYRHSREEMRELLAAKANVDRLMSMEIEHSFEQESNRTFAKESI